MQISIVKFLGPQQQFLGVGGIVRKKAHVVHRTWHVVPVRARRRGRQLRVRKADPQAQQRASALARHADLG